RACAAALRRIADAVREDFATPPPDAARREARAGALRQMLRALAVQAAGAGREARLVAWLRRRPVHGDPERIARLVSRTLHDATLPSRHAGLRRPGEPEPDGAALSAALAGALEDAARHLEQGRPMDREALRTHAHAALAAAPGAGWIAPTVRLLMQDLAALTRQDQATAPADAEVRIR
ncbi:MAG: hypothetical protein QM586_01090, partial [Xenophilus sp.]